MAGPHDVQFGVLGPVEAVVGRTRVDLAGAKQRALLAVLLVHRDEVVSTDRLVDELWGDEAPSTGHKALQVQVSRLRRALPDAALETRSTGYLLHVPTGCLDLDRFRALVAEARSAAGRGRQDVAAERLRAALAIWRGPALADASDSTDLAAAAARLEDDRLQALEDRIAADLALGRHAELVPELEQLVAAHPLRERLQAQLMLALYAAGRQADALARYQAYRRASVQELGLEPGRELRDLEQAILRQDPELTTHTLTPRAGRTRRRTARAVAVAVAALVVTGVVVASTVLDRPASDVRAATTDGQPDTGPDRVVAIDPATNRVEWATAVGAEPESMAATPGALWVANFGDRTVTRVDVATHGVRVLGGTPVAAHLVSTLDGDVWVSGFEEPVVTVLTENGRLSVTNQAEAPFTVRLPGSAEGMAVGGGYLWVTSPEDSGGADRVFQVDLRTRKLVRAIDVGHLPLFVCVGYGAAWVSNYRGDSLSVVRPGQQRPETVDVPPGPLGIASGLGGVWVVSYWTHQLTRIDPETLAVVRSVDVGGQPLSVAVGAGSVWVTSRADRTVERIDPRSGAVVARVHLDAPPQGVTVAHGRVWVTTHS